MGKEMEKFSKIDQQPYTPLMSPWMSAAYTFTFLLGILLSFKVQRVVLQTLGSMNKRHINIIIYPTLVSRICSTCSTSFSTNQKLKYLLLFALCTLF